MRIAKALAEARELQMPKRLLRIAFELPRIAPRSILFAISLAFFVIVVIVVESSFRIFFETNDDVGMMMIVHGFGLAAVPSPAMLYSNILEGKIIEFIGEPFGFTGYGIYTMSCLVAALAYIHATTAQVTQRYFSSLVLILALGLRAIFAPQFTITAGILAVAAVTALIAGPRRRSVSDLAIFAAFAIASFCMRDQIFFLVMILALPFLVDWPLKFDRRMLATAAGLTLLCIFLALLNARFYRDPSWQTFEAINTIRAPFTDFGLAGRILPNDARLAQVGLTPLDIKLVSNWWFIGIPADRLNQLVSLVGQTSVLSLRMSRISVWFDQYASASIATVTFLTLISFLAMPAARTPRPLLSLLILLPVTFIFAVAGKYDFSHVVYPCLFFLGIANLLFCTRWKLLLATALLVLPFAMNHFIQRAKDMRDVHDTVTASLATLDPAQVYVVWGGYLPYEALYRPLERRRDMPKLRFFGIGGSELAPFALARWNGSTDNFIEQLISPARINLFALSPEIDLLASFCAEKLHGRLKVQDVVSTPYSRHQRTSCHVEAAR